MRDKFGCNVQARLSGLRGLLELTSVRFPVDGTAELLFGFKGDVWPDAMFTIEIRDGKVRAVSLDDEPRDAGSPAYDLAWDQTLEEICAVFNAAGPWQWQLRENYM